MAEFYEEKMNMSKSYSDRYRKCKLLTDRETGEVLTATREIIDIHTSSSDKYHRVEFHELNRLDLIAYNYYKNPMLWWVIAQANNIFNPFEEMTAGTLLRIPSIETLYGNKGILL